MSHNLELSNGECGYFPLHQIDWDRNQFNGTLRFHHNPTKFANIIDMYIGMLRSDLENKNANQRLTMYNVAKYNEDLLEHQQHISRLWRWVALNPLCMLHTT